MKSKNKNKITTVRIFFFLTAVLLAFNFNAEAQDECLNICPTQGKLLNVLGEDPTVVNAVVCIDNLTRDNHVIQNGEELGNLPEALYTCYSVAVSNSSGINFDIASTEYSIDNIQTELDLALMGTEECGTVSQAAKTFDINSSYCIPCILDVCLCNEGVGTDFVFDYTSSGDVGEELFIVVDSDGIVVTVSSNSTISALGLDDGNYEIYAVIYDPAKAGNLPDLLSAGNTLVDIENELNVTACGTISSSINASVNADACDCDQNPYSAFCATDVCPCSGDINEVKLSTTGYTNEGNNEQWYIVVSRGAIVTSQPAGVDGTVTFSDLPDGSHLVYAVNYDPIANPNITAALADGNTWSDFEDGVNGGTYCADFVGPQDISINVFCNDCGGDSSITVEIATDDSEITDPAQPGQPLYYDYTICNTGDTDLTDINITSSLVGVPVGSIILAAGNCDDLNFSAVYYITSEDIDFGSVVISSIVSATSPNGIVTNTVDTTVPLRSTPPEACNNDAGIMPSSALNICNGSFANAPTTGATIDSGSALTYVLHNGVDNSIGVVIDQNSSGLFLNGGSYPTGIQLYICAVVSTSDLNSNCTDISNNCTPVTFLSKVEIEVDVDCTQNGNYSVIFEVSGGLPASQVGGLYSVSGDFTGLIAPNTPTTAGPFSAGTFYTLNISDNNGCGANRVSQSILCEKLPVDLISFSGEVQSQGNLLKWVTATEIENDYFTLERSVDGINFELIHTQKGAGTVSNSQIYSHLDRVAPNGISYYKLWQTDMDGTINYVGIVMLSRGETNLAIKSLLPIPVLDYLELTYTSISESQVELQIYDALGKQLGRKTVSAHLGLNNENLDVSVYPSGMYFLTIIQNDITITEKFIKE